MTIHMKAAPAATARSFRLTLASLIAALALAALDGNIVATALPVIASDLGGLEHLSWVVTSFMLAQSATLLLYGKLSDMYGRRPLFLFAVAIFILGSALSGMAQSMFQLILLRAVQGIGAAGIMTLSSATLADLVSPRDRGRYQGFFTGTFALCSIAGPLVGGGITSLFGWRWVFLVNLPLGLLVFGFLWWTLPRSAPRESHDIDYLGAGLIVASTVTGLLALSWAGAELPWSSPTILALFTASGLALWALIEREKRAGEPVLDLRLFRDGVFTTCSITNALVAFPFFGSVVFLPLYLQLARGFTPAQAGLIIVPQLGGLVLSSVLGGRTVSRTGHYRPLIVTGVVAIGSSLVAIGGAILAEAPLPFIMVGLATLGIGGGLAMPNLSVAVQNAVPREQLGAATSFNGFGNTLAAASGIATSGAILTGRVHAYIAAHATRDDAALLRHVGVTETAGLAPTARAVLIAAYSHAVATTFLTGGALVVVAVVAALCIPARELRNDLPVPSPFSE